MSPEKILLDQILLVHCLQSLPNIDHPCDEHPEVHTPIMRRDLQEHPAGQTRRDHDYRILRVLVLDIVQRAYEITLHATQRGMGRRPLAFPHVVGMIVPQDLKSVTGHIIRQCNVFFLCLTVPGDDNHNGIAGQWLIGAIPIGRNTLS